MTTRFFVTFTSLVLLGCQAKENPPTPDGPEEVEAYDGPTSSGIIPRYDRETLDAGDAVIDAGVIVIDTRCCATRFHLSDEESADTSGLLQGDSSAFGSGIPLERTDAGWQASLCFPLGASATYWYVLTSDAGFIDGGVEIDREDGGESIVLVPVTKTTIRASETEPAFDTSEGRRNTYRAVSSCDGLDGSVP